MGEWIYRSTIIDLVTGWRWVVSFTSLPLCPRGNSARYPLERAMGGPKSRSGHNGEEKISCPCQESKLDRPAYSPSLYRLSYSGSVTRLPSNVTFTCYILMFVYANLHPHVKASPAWDLKHRCTRTESNERCCLRISFGLSQLFFCMLFLPFPSNEPIICVLSSYFYKFVSWSISFIVFGCPSDCETLSCDSSRCQPSNHISVVYQ
jgi:hypothetical protein